MHVFHPVSHIWQKSWSSIRKGCHVVVLAANWPLTARGGVPFSRLGYFILSSCRCQELIKSPDRPIAGYCLQLNSNSNGTCLAIIPHFNGYLAATLVYSVTDIIFDIPQSHNLLKKMLGTCSCRFLQVFSMANGVINQEFSNSTPQKAHVSAAGGP